MSGVINPPVGQALKVSDLMRRWKCSRKSVLDAIKAHRLRAFKVGNSHYRILPDEVRRYEEGKTS